MPTSPHISQSFVVRDRITSTLASLRYLAALLETLQEPLNDGQGEHQVFVAYRLTRLGLIDELPQVYESIQDLSCLLCEITQEDVA